MCLDLLNQSNSTHSHQLGGSRAEEIQERAHSSWSRANAVLMRYRHESHADTSRTPALSRNQPKINPLQHHTERRVWYPSDYHNPPEGRFATPERLQSECFKNNVVCDLPRSSR